MTAHPETGTAVFELGTVHGKDASDSSEGMKKGADAEEALDEETRTHAPETDARVRNGEADAEATSEEKARTTAPRGDAEGQSEEKARTNQPKDPIRMFGILTPQALRLAQGSAVKVVEDLVPRLASVDAEMKEVEIKIRRARKHRAKAEALEKSGETTLVEESRTEGVVS